jgi:hypothetical protein
MPLGGDPRTVLVAFARKRVANLYRNAHVAGIVTEPFSCVLYRPMEYRGIDYAVRARPGRNEWLWTISPKQGCAITGQFTGTRDDATAAARRAISRLLERQTQAAQKTIDRV